MSKTKIVIIQLKEIIYTAIFVILGILLILLLIFMFWPKNKEPKTAEITNKYTAGVYTTELTLNDSSLNLEVVVDNNHINSVRIVNLDEAVTTMYPLIAPSLEEISKQLCNDIAIEKIVLSEESKYTQTLLLDTIQTTLEKAKVKTE